MTEDPGWQVTPPPLTEDIEVVLEAADKMAAGYAALAADPERIAYANERRGFNLFERLTKEELLELAKHVI
jgi:hypothetical protein